MKFPLKIIGYKKSRTKKINMNLENIRSFKKGARRFYVVSDLCEKLEVSHQTVKAFIKKENAKKDIDFIYEEVKITDNSKKGRRSEQLYLCLSMESVLKFILFRKKTKQTELFYFKVLLILLSNMNFNQ